LRGATKSRSFGGRLVRLGRRGSCSYGWRCLRKSRATGISPFAWRECGAIGMLIVQRGSGIHAAGVVG
jgi:hypothetical protein